MRARDPRRAAGARLHDRKSPPIESRVPPLLRARAPPVTPALMDHDNYPDSYIRGIVQEALALNPRPQVIWMQLGIRNDEAAKIAEAAGLKVVMNRCPKIEYGRLSSEIAWMGVNTRTLSSQKAKLFGRGIQRMSLNRTTTAGGTTEASERAQKDESSR